MSVRDQQVVAALRPVGFALLVAVGMLAAPAVTGAQLEVATNAAAKLPTYWVPPYGFPGNADPNPYLQNKEIDGPRRSLDLAVGAGSLWTIRNLTWTPWGRATVTARGRARYCDDYCESWRPVRIVLLARRGVICGDSRSPTQYEYARYRTWGFGHERVSRLDGVTFRSNRSAC